MEPLEGLQKSIFSTSKMKKKTEIHMGSIQQNLQAQPKILTNFRNTKSNNQNVNFLKKTMFSILKKKREQKLLMGATRATRQNLQPRPKILKKLLKHQIYQLKRKFAQKNYSSYLKSEKEPKIRMRATRRNLQAPSNIRKKY
jgi:hypothetical protein